MGKLKIDGDLLLTGSISFQTPNCITPAFSAKVDSSGYGQNLLIGAGGNTVIGGGEGAQEFFAAAGIKDEENIYLAATSIYMYTDCNDIANRKLVMSLNADGTISLPNSKKIDTDGTFSGNAAGIYRANHFTTEEGVDSFQAINTLQYCTIGAEYTPIGNDGILISAGWSSGKYGAQIWIDDGGSSGGMKIRSFGANDGTKWNEWQTVLTNGNYNSYAPTKTGVGASGTWGINITGNSATATKFASTQSISLTGDTTGSASSQAGWSLSTTTKKISYDTQLTTNSAINSFNVANKLQIATWDSTSSPGVSNGIIINGGWTSTDYGFQLAIDDDPTWYIALRQKNASGWNAWKRIPMGDGTGASGTWGIDITGTAALSNRLAIKGVASGDNHALALKNYFESNKSSIPRNELTTYFSTAYGNGSLYMGYFLGGYDSTPYGGFFVSHYDTPYYVGISYNNYNQQTILTSFNYGSWCAPVSHSHSSYLPLSGGTMTGTLRVNNAPIFGYMYGANNNAAAFIWDKNGSNYTGVGACNITDVIHFGPCNASGDWVANYNQIWRFQGGVYATGWLESDNYGSSAPGSSTPGYGRKGAIYYQV